VKDETLARVLVDKGLAQFGDSLLNFAYSKALTETTGKPMGTKVADKVLAEAAVKSGLRKLLPRRVGRGEVANGLEALLGHSFLEKRVTLDEVVSCLKDESNMIPSENFARLAELALARFRE
jgi:hypothetical protein